MTNTITLELPRTYLAPIRAYRASRLERLVERQRAAQTRDLAFVLSSFAFALLVVCALVGV